MTLRLVTRLLLSNMVSGLEDLCESLMDEKQCGQGLDNYKYVILIDYHLPKLGN